MLSRRSLLKGSLLFGSAFFLDFAGIAWPSSLRTRQNDRKGKLLRILDFIDESPVPLDTPRLGTRWSVVFEPGKTRARKSDYPHGKFLHSHACFGAASRPGHLASETRRACREADESGNRGPEESRGAHGNALDGMRGQRPPSQVWTSQRRRVGRRPRFRNPGPGQSNISNRARSRLGFRSLRQRIQNFHPRRKLGIFPRATRKGLSRDRIE